MSDQSDSIEKLILSGKKVFTIEDLAVLWRIPERRVLIERIKHYLRTKRLNSIYKGVYSYGTDYTPQDVAQKLVPLSYISLYTASQFHGLTFQYYSSIYCISLKSKVYTIKEQGYVYHKVKDSIFYNTEGLVNNGRYIIADKERTICDMLYVFPSISFDNLYDINIDRLEQISKIYNNKSLEKSVKQIIDIIHADYA